jgi:hypothetical protein
MVLPFRLIGVRSVLGFDGQNLPDPNPLRFPPAR